MTHRVLSVIATLAVLSFAPGTARAQEAAFVCADGSHTIGSCDRHGGIDTSATRIARSTLKPPNKKYLQWQTDVVCDDGTHTDPVGGDTCIDHGGVRYTIMTSTLGPTGSLIENGTAESDSAGTRNIVPTDTATHRSKHRSTRSGSSGSAASGRPLRDW